MRITGWPLNTDADEGILPVTLADVDFQGTSQEVRKIGEFLLKAATELKSPNKRDDIEHRYRLGQFTS